MQISGESMTNSGDEVMTRLVLDTSAYSHMRAGRDRVIRLIADADAVLIPVTVLGELEGAFELSRRANENRVVLADFLSEPFVSILPATVEIARRYGLIYAQLRRAGTPIPVNDIWIAAAAMDSGGRLLTYDRHFGKVQGLDCVILD